MIGTFIELANKFEKINVDTSNGLYLLWKTLTDARLELGKIYKGSNNNLPLDLKSKEAKHALRIFALKLHEVLSKDIRASTSEKCAENWVELEVIKVLGMLKLPMDFPITINGKTLYLHEIVTQICQRASLIIEKNSRVAGASTYTRVLSLIALIDLSASKDLSEASDNLIKVMLNAAFTRANNYQTWLNNDAPLEYQAWLQTQATIDYSEICKDKSKPFYKFSDWSTYENWLKNKFDDEVVGEQCIYLLRANFLHGIKEDGTFDPIFNSAQTIILLNHIAQQVAQGKMILDLALAKCLFQIYAANYAFKDQFPQSLYKCMIHFIPEFKKGAQNSEFEDKVQEIDFKAWNGIFHSLKRFAYISWQESLDFSNPIIEEIGLETDILFYHPQTGYRIAIQVDGEDYHTYQSWDKTQIRNNKRTQFRDFCFDSVGIKTAHITSRGTDNIIPVLIEKVVMPVHSALQKQRLTLLKNRITELEVKRNKLIESIQERSRTKLTLKNAHYDSLLEELKQLSTLLMQLNEKIKDFSALIKERQHEYHVLHEQMALISIDLNDALALKAKRTAALNEAIKANDDIENEIKTHEASLRQLRDLQIKLTRNSLKHCTFNDLKEMSKALEDKALTNIVKNGVSSAKLKKGIDYLEKIYSDSNALEQKLTLKEHELHLLQAKRNDSKNLKLEAEAANSDYQAINAKMCAIYQEIAKIEAYLENKNPGKGIHDQFSTQAKMIEQTLVSIEKKLNISHEHKEATNCFSYAQKLICKDDELDQIFAEKKSKLESKAKLLKQKLSTGFLLYSIDEQLALIKSAQPKDIHSIEDKLNAIEMVIKRTYAQDREKEKHDSDFFYEETQGLVYQMGSFSLMDKVNETNKHSFADAVKKPRQ